MIDSIPGRRQMAAIAVLGIAALVGSGCFNDHHVAPVRPAQTLSLGGTLAGLQGAEVTLRTDTADILTLTRDGPFVFSGKYAPGSPYTVSVVIPPSNPAQKCVLTNASGILVSADVTSIRVECMNQPTPVLRVTPGVYSAQLSWDPVNGAARHDIVVSTNSDCTAENYSTCPDGRLLVDVTSPYRVTELRAERKYFFRLETSYDNSARGLSSPVSTNPRTLAFSGAVRAIQKAPDGTVYLGGDFHRLDIFRGSGVPLDATSGEPSPEDHETVGSVDDFSVTTAIPDQKGGWYIGGRFTDAGGEPRSHVAHILADGSVDPDWKPTANGWVRALALTGDTVYLGGEFTAIDGEPRVRLAAISTRGQLLPWNPGANQTVRTLAAREGNIYIGGEFTQVAGATRNYLAAVAPDGRLLSWNPDSSGIVLALAMADEGIYAGGSFSRIGGASRLSLALLDTDGAALPWNPNEGIGTVQDIAPAGDTIYIAGPIQQGSESRQYLSAIDKSGKLLAWNPAPDGIVWTIEVSGNTVYAGGYFRTMAGVERHWAAAIDANGAVLPWNPQPNGAVWALAASGNTVYMGGGFTGLGPGFTRNGLAALGPDGSLLPWNPDANDSVYAMILDGNTLYVGGSFTQMSGEYRGGLAALGTDGSLRSWAPEIWLNPRPLIYVPQVLTLALHNSTIYVGGAFDYVNGFDRASVAAIDLDGNLTSWNPGAHATFGPAYVRAIETSGDTVYIGGSMVSVAGQPRRYLAAVDSNGALLPWRPEPDAPIFSIAVAEQTIYVGGQFRSIAGTPRSSAAAISADGTLLPWSPAADNTVSLILPMGSNIYLGGYFRRIGDESREFLACVDVNGSVTSWNPGINSVPYAIAASEGQLAIGGAFTAIAHAANLHYGVVSATTAAPLR